MCVDECVAAGYAAIEFANVGTVVDENGNPLEASGMLAPVVLPHKCVGCGLCQTRCYGINVKEKGQLFNSAITVAAGHDYEDRLAHGSYVDLRRPEIQHRDAARHRAHEGEYVVPSLDPTQHPDDANAPSDRPPGPNNDDPFGIDGSGPT